MADAETKDNGNPESSPRNMPAAAVASASSPAVESGGAGEEKAPSKGKTIEAFEGDEGDPGDPLYEDVEGDPDFESGRRRNPAERRSDGRRPARSRSASPNPDAKWAARERSPPRGRQPIDSYQGYDDGPYGGGYGGGPYGGPLGGPMDGPMGGPIPMGGRMRSPYGPPPMMDDAPECRDWTMGRCFRQNCRYRHDRGPPMGGPMGGPVMGVPNEFAEPCKDWMNGKCFRGNRCRYAHTDEYIPPPQRAQNDFYGGGGSSGGGQYSQNGFPGGGFVGSDMKREKCRDFMYGKCARGALCKFQHEDRGVDMCKDFQNGKCLRGAECKFLHETLDGSMGMSRYGGEVAGEEMRGPNSIPVCKDFQNGRCNRGTMCRYLHDMSGGGSMGVSGDFGGMGGGFNEECRDFLLGRCFRGGSCRFRHPEGAEGTGHAQSAILEPCKDFLRGMCKRDAFCKYSHDVSRDQL